MLFEYDIKDLKIYKYTKCSIPFSYKGKLYKLNLEEDEYSLDGYSVNLYRVVGDELIFIKSIDWYASASFLGRFLGFDGVLDYSEFLGNLSYYGLLDSIEK